MTVIPDSARAGRERQQLINAASTPMRGAQNGQLTANQLRTLAGLHESDSRNATSLAQEQMQQDGATGRAAMTEAGQAARFAASNQLDQQRLQGEQETRGFQTRAAQRMEKLYEQYEKAKPQDRAGIAEQIRALTGKEQANRFTVVPGGQEYDSQAMQMVNRPARVLNNQTGQFLDTANAPSQASAQQFEKGKVYTDANGTQARWDGNQFVPL